MPYETTNTKVYSGLFHREAGAFITAGANSLRIYNFIKWKEGMLKKLGYQYDYWISMGNDEFQKHFEYIGKLK